MGRAEAERRCVAAMERSGYEHVLPNLRRRGLLVEFHAVANRGDTLYGTEHTALGWRRLVRVMEGIFIGPPHPNFVQTHGGEGDHAD